MSLFTDNPFISTAWRYLVYPQMWTRQTPDWTGLTWSRFSAPCRWVEMMDSDVISLLYTAASKHGPAQRSAARLTVPLTAYRDYVKSQLGYFMMAGLNSFSLPHQMWSQLYVITNISLCPAPWRRADQDRLQLRRGVLQPSFSRTTKNMTREPGRRSDGRRWEHTINEKWSQCTFCHHNDPG